MANGNFAYLRRKAFRTVKNVGKGFGYIAIDELERSNPAVISVANQYKAIQADFRQARAMKNEKASNAFNKAYTNKSPVTLFKRDLLSDIRSGNWYNKGRIKADERTGFDSDFNFDDNDFEFSFDDIDADVNKSNKPSIGEAFNASSQKSASIISRKLDSIGARTSQSILESNFKTADYIVQANAYHTKALFDATNMGFDRVMTGVAAVNNNLQQLTAIVRPLNDHLQNSQLFYTQMTRFENEKMELLHQMNDSIKKIVEYTAPQTAAGRRSNGPKFNLNALLTNGGILNPKAYKQMIKENMGDVWKYTLLPMLGVNADSGGGTGKISSSPLLLGAQLAMLLTNTTMLPRSLTKSMEAFNKSLQGMFTGALTRARGFDLGNLKMFQDGKGGVKNAELVAILNDIKNKLLPESSYKSNINTGNYNKGKVDWDGISRKALIDVIPTQLGKILAALTGDEEQRYDYNRGSWVTVSQARQNKKLEKSASAQVADFNKLMLSGINNIRHAGSRRSMQDSLAWFNEAAFESGTTDYMRLLTANNLTVDELISFGFAKRDRSGKIVQDSNGNVQVDVQAYKNFRRMVDQLKKSRQGKAAISSYAGNMHLGRDRYGDTMRD